MTKTLKNKHRCRYCNKPYMLITGAMNCTCNKRIDKKIRWNPPSRRKKSIMSFFKEFVEK